MPARALPGFREFYPEEISLRNHIFAAWRNVARRYGFEEYDGPPLEPLELYTEKSGPEIVGQLYEFVDKGQRRVALRPEMTPTLARMVGARAASLKKPIRWYSIPQLFRYERQQRGRLREHFQLNMDIIGEPGPLADAEIIGAAIDVQRALGLGPEDVRVRISDRRVLRCLLLGAGVPEEDLTATFMAIDRVGRVQNVAELIEKALEHAPEDRTAIAKRVLEIASIRDRGRLEKALGDVGAGSVAEGLLDCLDALRAMGFEEFVDLDLSIVRGLAYYTGIVFELFDAQQSLRAICGGGRYDGLLGALGGADLPAVGFGMGDVVLGELIKEKNLLPSKRAALDVFIVAVTGADMPEVLALARELRDAGIAVEYPLRLQSVAKQLKLAAAREARWAVIVGPEERSEGKILLRDLASGSEEKVGREALLQRLGTVTAGK
ncbi:MAG: histidine--tRNA ligase [Gemmatimonadales bacterium]|nr:MAG: histidine--tRNA ligase [Gemmatimonadales bacterium]